MANLIIPNKSQHQFVIGIDFGHGETSAAKCKIEWEKEAGQRELDVRDIDLDRAARKKVITSAICRTEDDDIKIGDEAFDHMTDNNGIRIGFKQKPESLKGENERLMIDFMKVVYSRIREYCEELTDTNHVVYIARPSGWVEEESKELYRQMALEAGIPLAGLTSESRAAIFYAKKGPSINFANKISNGAIVFDLGSSTVDFTYLSSGVKPIDGGDNLGASIIDEAIYEKMILANPAAKEFVQKHPQYVDALKFKARKFKEQAYSKGDNDSRTPPGDFVLDSIIPYTEPYYEDYVGILIMLRVKNLAELTNIVDEHTHYLQELKNALIKFKNEKINGKQINGVFLTGGASRMNFIRPIIAESLDIDLNDVKIDGDNPSLTISRGIAMLGTTDAITYILKEELQKSMSSYAKDKKLMGKLIEKLSNTISNDAWKEVEAACKFWVKNGITTDMDELQETIEKRLKSFQSKIPSILNKTLSEFLADGAEDIRKKMNKIISQYEPGREITYSKSVALTNASQMSKGLVGMSSIINEVCESISGTVKRIIWDILITILFGLIGLGIKFIIGLFETDEEKRSDKAEKILEKKHEVIAEVKAKSKQELTKNRQFQTSVSRAIEDYFNEVISNNLEQVIIPIE